MDALNTLFPALLQDGLSNKLMQEFAWLLLSLFLAWVFARQLGRHAAPDSILFGRHLLDGLLLPMVALLLTYMLDSVVYKHQSHMLFKLAIPLLLSLVLIRLCARVLMAVFPTSPMAALTERLISWLAWLVAVLWISDLLPIVAHEMEQIHVNFGKTRLDLRTLFEGVLSSGLVLVLTLWVSATIEQRVLSQTVADLSMRKVAGNVLRAVLLLIGLLLVLSAVGVDLTALSVLGGALGVGLGLGLQKLAANYVSGFVVLVERAVRIGDVIRVDGIEGVVTDIKTRYTLLRDANGRESIIPNEMLLTQRVDNFSLTQSSVALQSTLTVSVDSDVEHVQAVLCQAALQVPQVLQDPPPQAYFTAFTQDGLVMTLHLWVADLQLGKQVVLSEVHKHAWAAMKKAGIELPPTKPALAPVAAQPAH
jgi:small-conductance mechanosensitive channel